MKDPKNLVWMDLEMTGLDPERDTILEIATLVTNSYLEIVAEGPCIAIHHPDEVLAGMDPWCVQHHGASGLTKRVQQSGICMAEAEEKTLAFIRELCPDKTSPLCGSSVHQDRRFLARHMLRLNGYLHYRLIDVSTVKELAHRWYPFGPKPPPKAKRHLALGDIRESLEELLFYRQHFFK